MSPTIGRTVHYVLNEDDAKQINRRRTDGPSIAARIREEKWPLGAQAHIGSEVQAGDVLPAVVVKVWSDGDNPPVNLRVFLDGNDAYWATSRMRNDGDPSATGTWHWPPRES